MAGDAPVVFFRVFGKGGGGLAGFWLFPLFEFGYFGFPKNLILNLKK